MRVIVDAAAWRDLDDIGAWIARDNPGAARRILRHPSSAARTISGTVSSTAAEATRICSAEVIPLPSCGCSSNPRLSSHANFSGVRP